MPGMDNDMRDALAAMEARLVGKMDVAMADMREFSRDLQTEVLKAVITAQ